MVIIMIQDVKPLSGFYNNMLGCFGHTIEVKDSGLTLYDRNICTYNSKCLLVWPKIVHTFPR